MDPYSPSHIACMVTMVSDANGKLFDRIEITGIRNVTSNNDVRQLMSPTSTLR